MKDILYGLGAVLLLALAVIWGLALALAGPALLKFCILYLFEEMSKTGRRSSPQTGKWETKEFRGISRAQKP